MGLVNDRAYGRKERAISCSPVTKQGKSFL
jgi:hypothetical protein